MPCHARDKGKSTRYCTEASQERYGHVRQVCMHVHSLARNSRPGNTACARPGASAVGWTQSATTLRVSARTCMKATDVDSHWFQVICDRLFLPCIDPWARNPRGGRPWVFVLHEDRPIAQWRCTLGFTIGHSWLGWLGLVPRGPFRCLCKLQVASHWTLASRGAGWISQHGWCRAALGGRCHFLLAQQRGMLFSGAGLVPKKLSSRSTGPCDGFARSRRADREG